MSIDENTLGVPRHRRAARGLPTSSTGARSLRQAQQAGATLGTGYLGMGAAAVAAVQAIYGLIFFLVHLSQYPVAAPAIVAWLIYLAAFIGVVTLVAIQGERLTGVVMIVLCAALALVVVLDFVAIWPLHNIGAFATASVSVGFGLLPLVTLRPARELVVAAAILLIVFVVAVILTTPLNRETFPQQMSVIAIAILPSAVAIYAVQRFRHMVQIELDRVLVQSTVTQPRFAVGMLASDELARLDLAAEKLLDGVATGDVPSPRTRRRLHRGVAGHRAAAAPHRGPPRDLAVSRGHRVRIPRPRRQTGRSVVARRAPHPRAARRPPAGRLAPARRPPHASGRHEHHPDPRSDRHVELDRLARRAHRRGSRRRDFDRYPPQPRDPGHLERPRPRGRIPGLHAAGQFAARHPLFRRQPRRLVALAKSSSKERHPCLTPKDAFASPSSTTTRCCSVPSASGSAALPATSPWSQRSRRGPSC
ncbi:hypothetical protein GCM10025867_33490 [Frondihabitans sucicola]|uniref:Uncharacterized protein n=1 Tax=Frondihabitans sucicola TaxID=1268041 RepID=A0ABM8GRL2_9MICO|nr:hypothetical protein [Frondihabitans sucicola]BDZ51108.1 hypothetical protein GCM10025867_33490 [Frondihabitans sucicola]